MAAHLALPFGPAPTGGTATVGEDGHIRDMIRAVLFTSPGERANRPEFGCGLAQLVFAPLSDTLVATTQHLVQGALLRWLGDVIRVETVEARAEEGMLSIAVVWSVIATAERQSAVFERAIAT